MKEKIKGLFIAFFNLKQYQKDYIESIISIVIHFGLLFGFGVTTWAAFILIMFCLQSLMVAARYFGLLEMIGKRKDD